MPLLDEYENPKLGYLYVRDEAIGNFKPGYEVILLTPSAIIRGIQVAQRECHQERIKLLDEQWEANNSPMTVLRAILADQEKQIRMLMEKIDSREARIKYLNSRPWWLRALRR